MIKPYSTHDQGISNFLLQKEIPEHLQQCSVCEPGEIFLTSKFSCLVFSNLAPIKLKLGLQIGERLLIENHLNQSLLVWPVPLAQVLPRPQLIFPSKTWASWNLFEFSVAKITLKSISPTF
jgi:hypothetical protein